MPDIMERKEPRSVYHNWEATAIIKKKKRVIWRKSRPLSWRVTTKIFLRISLILLLVTVDLDEQVIHWSVTIRYFSTVSILCQYSRRKLTMVIVQYGLLNSRNGASWSLLSAFTYNVQFLFSCSTSIFIFVLKHVPLFLKEEVEWIKNFCL